jgi:succinate dehydrogenase/fumarate reductase flavoprotein subunit
MYAALEAARAGGANGANRLSGNAITGTFVFGARAGHHAALRAMQRTMPSPDVAGLRSIFCGARSDATHRTRRHPSPRCNP